MANEHTTTTTASIINPEEISRRFYEAARSNLVMMGLIAQAKIAYGTKTISVPRRVASTSFTTRTNDTDTFANVSWTPTDVTATPSTIGRTATISDEAAASTIVPLAPQIAYDSGRDLANKIDTDIAALLDGLSNEVGTTLAPSDLDLLQLAIYTLANLKAPRPYAFIGQTTFWYHVKLALGGAGLTSTVYAQSGLYQFLGPAAMNGYGGEIYGCAAYESSNMKSINSAADFANGLIAVGDNSPIMIAWKELEGGGLWTPRAEAIREPRVASTVVTLTTSYAVLEPADDFGVQITATQTA